MESGALLHPTLKQLLTKKEQLRIFTHQRGRVLQRVDFANPVPADGFNTGMYRILLMQDIPSDSEVACVFPNHPDPRKQVIISSAYYQLDSFNRALNERLRESLDFTDGVGTVKLCVCYGNHAFVCQGISGTAYVVWARHVNHTNHSNVASVLHSNVPLVINMDGCMLTKHVFILKPVVQDARDELACIPITRASPEIYFPMGRAIFVSEVKLAVPRRAEVRTLPYQQALQYVMARDAALPGVALEPNPYSIGAEASVDAEMSWIAGTAGFNYGEGPDSGTPRGSLFCEEVPVDLRRLQGTPPVPQESDAETPPDPFARRYVPKKENVI